MPKKGNSNRPPNHLSPEAKGLRTGIQTEYQLDDAAGLRLLQLACEALDQLRVAESILKADGLLVVDRYGCKRAHPMLGTVRDSRSAMLASLRALNLDLEPLRDKPGRPVLA